VKSCTAAGAGSGGVGVGGGDRVATLLWNQPEHVELYFAVTGMGAVIHTLNPRLHPDELAFIVDDAQDKLGAATNRAEAHVVRLAAIYATLDRDRQIRLPHLEAALALWRYSADSARWIFGDSLGDPTAEVWVPVLAPAA